MNKGFNFQGPISFDNTMISIIMKGVSVNLIECLMFIPGWLIACSTIVIKYQLL